MKVIGLTGGIGSGKSTVSKFLAHLGAVVIDADKVGHEVFKPGTKAWQEVVDAFGQGIISADGTIDRRKLGEIVFSNPGARAKLNQVMHPLIYKQVKSQMEEYGRKGAAIIIVEAPLLLEVGWKSLVDEVWVTSASEATVIKRLKEQKGLSEAQSLARIRAQLTDEERIRQADVVIDTDCALDELKERVEALWRKLRSRI
ncbi:MAG: dephospho-CoA kinase [Dehalococcoidia bacterium]|nr:MAG: dephospho-CoA kinase [Dehalococcoidia bacterium]